MARTPSNPFAVILLLMGAAALSGTATAQSCLAFLSPPQATPLSSKACTVSVDACDGTRSVEFTALYNVPGENEPRQQVLGNITRPPFKLVWNMQDIPNQVYEGMSLVAETTLRNRERDTTRREGIFLTHKPVKRPRQTAPYRLRGWTRQNGSFSLSAPDRPGKAEINVSWNEHYLVFYLAVQDPFFYSDLQANELNKLGAEIMIDAKSARKPFPSEAALVYSIPIKGAPRRVVYRPEQNENGSFALAESTHEVSYPNRIRTEDFKGYQIEFGVPWSAMGEEVPPKVVVANIAVHLLDTASNAEKIAWAAGTGHAIYAPFLWGEIHLRDKPVLASPWLLWLVSFAGGITLGLGLLLLYRLLVGMSSLGRFERTETEERLLHDIMNTIEERITDPNLGQTRVAQLLSVSPGRINRILKRRHGEGFKQCLMRSRVEIVKERLRSSHSSEAAIATSCGFASVDEMEKYFKRYCRTTPYRFREEHQVT
ncbi:MAG: helix-turn-helix domain-containing protein [Chitinivibrionales bacterium]|nr:helix-turn-helix domain-containing protein [Chitinivibrionales bacterium]MBD3357215.1 helix-turn-helix domain-containing protein [Chitinivibrionales bacterium]